MHIFKKSPENPILIPERANSWEAEAAFNPSVVFAKGTVHMVYRALSRKTRINGDELEVSTIGHAAGKDGIHFENKKQLIVPKEPWEKYGVEDPRITKISLPGQGDKYFIFYTALSKYPFSAEGIKIGVAISKNLKKIDERHLVTPFNAKAMTLFPGKINGKYAAMLTAHTDSPPAKICLALFDKIEDIWSEEYWNRWHNEIDSHTLALQRHRNDQVEVGAPPIKTKRGWLIFYSYIENYFSGRPTFGVRVALLDLKNPQKIIGRIDRPLLVPDEEYEQYGKIPNIVFPSGAIVKNSKLYVYYGAADTTCAVAEAKLSSVLEEIEISSKIKLVRYENNPTLTPIESHFWESRLVFNPAATYENGRVHLLYRAMGSDNTSVFGYASSKDGFVIDERLPEPVYIPREDFERKSQPGNSGCEDPRITKIGDRFYVCYTAYDGKNEPRVALTSISLSDFLEKRWNWKKTILISPPNVSDKDAAVFPKKINGKYVFLHRLGSEIWIDYVNNLDFKNNRYLSGSILMSPRHNRWDSKKIGIAAPPIETKYGWLLLYHGISKEGTHYRTKAALLDLKNPSKVIARTSDPILEPEMPYEKEGEVGEVVFPCGAVVIKDTLFVYYGGADKVIGTATIKIQNLLDGLLREAKNNKRPDKDYQ